MNQFFRLYLLLCVIAFPSLVFSRDADAQRHTSVIPNLVEVYISTHDGASDTLLTLQPVLHNLHTSIMQEEQALLDAALDNEQMDLLDQMGQRLMQSRLELIKQGINGLAILKQELNGNDFKALMAAYDKSTSQALLHESRLLLSHSNPLPNLVSFVLINDAQPALLETQIERLQNWQSELKPVFEHRAKAIVELETELLERVLNGDSFDAIEELADKMLQLRVSIIRGKVFSRERVMQVLQNEQYQNLLGRYPAP